ncbi:MAG: hypothetical protein HRK26_01475 [Rickettsiaceae bacterium H1]|nr:hypothetical protein [Rickettsiaceae bacterium H1]
MHKSKNKGQKALVGFGLVLLDGKYTGVKVALKLERPENSSIENVIAETHHYILQMRDDNGFAKGEVSFNESKDKNEIIFNFHSDKEDRYLSREFWSEIFNVLSRFGLRKQSIFPIEEDGVSLEEFVQQTLNKDPYKGGVIKLSESEKKELIAAVDKPVSKKRVRANIFPKKLLETELSKLKQKPFGNSNPSSLVSNAVVEKTGEIQKEE